MGESLTMADLDKLDKSMQVRQRVWSWCVQLATYRDALDLCDVPFVQEVRHEGATFDTPVGEHPDLYGLFRQFSDHVEARWVRRKRAAILQRAIDTAAQEVAEALNRYGAGSPDRKGARKMMFEYLVAHSPYAEQFADL